MIRFFYTVIHKICNSSTLHHSLLIVAIGTALYANTLKAPFLFDDFPCIVDNKAIITYFDTSLPVAEKYANMNQDIVNSMDSRRVTYFTFAMNYLLYEFDVTGYHLVNLMIHLSAALAVYFLVATLLRTDFFTDHPSCMAFTLKLPLVTALLFVSHPIQTSAVTYISQRFTSLAVLFYLLALIFYLRARMAENVIYQATFLASSVGIAVVGMYTKEIVFTLPVIAAVCEVMFLRGRWGRRILFLLPLLCTMLIIPLNMMSQLDTTGSSKEVFDDAVNLANLTAVSQKVYFLTQLRVIVTYLRLLTLPVNQHLDYDYPRYNSFFDLPVAMSALLIAGVVLSAGWAFHCSRRASTDAWALRLLSFGVVWFFISISMSSSIIPLDDMIFEYRLYLPSFGFFIAVGSMGVYVWQKFGMSGSPLEKPALAGIIVILLALSSATILRNHIWGDPVRFWEDNVAKAPGKLRPHQYLAMRYDEAGQTDNLIGQYLILIKLSPGNPDNYKYWNNVAIGYAKLEKSDEAFDAIEKALALKPDDHQLQATHECLLDSFSSRAEASEQRK